MVKNNIFLVQTDTTVGFLSKDNISLSKVKRRDINKKTLEVLSDFSSLKENTRVPTKYKNFIRRSKKTTFIYPKAKAYRVVDKKSNHNSFLNRFGKFYSTSANYTGKNFEYNFAYDNCDVLIENNQGYSETTPSKIYKINNLSIKKIR